MRLDQRGGESGSGGQRWAVDQRTGSIGGGSRLAKHTPMASIEVMGVDGRPEEQPAESHMRDSGVGDAGWPGPLSRRTVSESGGLAVEMLCQPSSAASARGVCSSWLAFLAEPMLGRTGSGGRLELLRLRAAMPAGGGRQRQSSRGPLISLTGNLAQRVMAAILGDCPIIDVHPAQRASSATVVPAALDWLPARPADPGGGYSTQCQAVARMRSLRHSAVTPKRRGRTKAQQQKRQGVWAIPSTTPVLAARRCPACRCALAVASGVAHCDLPGARRRDGGGRRWRLLMALLLLLLLLVLLLMLVLCCAGLLCCQARPHAARLRGALRDY